MTIPPPATRTDVTGGRAGSLDSAPAPSDDAERPPVDPCCTPLAAGALDEREIDELSRGIELLAHPVRLQILSVLAGSVEPVCVCDLEAVLPVKQPTVSHHLRILRDGGLVEAARRGCWTYCSVRSDAVRELRERMDSRLARLEPVSAVADASFPEEA
jgi:ArsR family transcriptional regulator, arsenate/arsenite/antimonite-responsive transcriptional repressor